MIPQHRTKHQHRFGLVLMFGVVILAGVTWVGAGVSGAASSGSSRPSAVQVIRIYTHAFDWGDAGIGAAAGIGLSMLGVGAALLVTSARREQPHPRPTAKEQPRSPEPYRH